MVARIYTGNVFAIFMFILLFPRALSPDSYLSHTQETIGVVEEKTGDERNMVKFDVLDKRFPCTTSNFQSCLSKLSSNNWPFVSMLPVYYLYADKITLRPSIKRL
jgi:hypothetical protein